MEPAADLAAEWLGRLRPELDGYARLALDNIGREFPSYVAALMTGPGDFPVADRQCRPVPGAAVREEAGCPLPPGDPRIPACTEAAAAR